MAPTHGPAAAQAHEYGHSYHHKALGGIGHIYVSSGNPMHSFDSNSNGAKALLEGFATFFETGLMECFRARTNSAGQANLNQL